MSGQHYLGLFEESSDFTCSGSTCRTDQPRVKNTFKQLQYMINGVMHIVKGTKISTDGVIGKGTVAGLRRAIAALPGLKKTVPGVGGSGAVSTFAFAPSAKIAAQSAQELSNHLLQYVGHLPSSAFKGGVLAKITSALPDIPEAAGGDYTKYGLLALVGYLAYKKFKR